MLLKYFYDKHLAHASYMVGCQATGEAIVVDPGRDVEPYLRAATAEGLRIVGAAETHIHADYVSGARALAERVGAVLFVSDEGPPEWKYLYAKQYAHRLLEDGDTFRAGKVEFRVLHTPGHTPESVSFLLTDKGGGADRPMGIFTGDFVFVGSIGRPDLLEEAAGIADTAEPGARDLFRSIDTFKALPDFLQVWPAHGAGSACGKGLGAVPSSTVGYEKLFNPALQFEDEEAFVDYILSEQPEAPRYFATMKRVNKEGPALIDENALPPEVRVDELAVTVERHVVVDTAPPAVFGGGHVPGTINIDTRHLAMWGGSLLDPDRPLYLISHRRDLPEQVRVLRKIGMDNVAGSFDAEAVRRAGADVQAIPQETPSVVAERMARKELVLVDVRGRSERHELAPVGSEHRFLGAMANGPGAFDEDKAYAFLCRSGNRSMIAASLAQRAGARNVINVAGGVQAWKKAGLAVTSG